MPHEKVAIDAKRVLGLELPTDPRWVNLAEMDLEEILSDHAYCEMKAATNCISLISQFSGRKRLVAEVSPVVTEEWGHFRQVVRELDKRGLTLQKQRKDQYVNQLRKFQRGGGAPEDQLLEKLLTCALIEARSCERFRLLSLHISDDELKDFYHQFMVSEAGHYKMFLELARHYCGADKTATRWREYLVHEAEILANLEVRGDRMH